ncbi:DASH family cryptochrome [Rheinheimera riviphila]|uniref:Cryptochrome DASH n=1 Tax=Rheinheimera riviphila TaxID=1834037 RepID=A0A437QR95_9GAMM|nr:DASH family cryptochrome [Rheinheimera riviphila]RVU36997.1 DASH family cryptochrome [Rheinheimera riviphila]
MQQIPQQQNEQQTQPNQPTTAVYWFRNDFRLADNPALSFACQQSLQHGSRLALVVCLPEDQQTHWGFARIGPHRKVYLADTVRALAAQCELLGNKLLLIAGDPSTALPDLMHKLGASTLYCEDIAAPEEIDQIAVLRQQAVLVNGFQISPLILTKWQSSLIEPTALPFEMTELPLVFTTFRNLLEKAACRPQPPLPRVSQLPACPEQATAIECIDLHSWAGIATADTRSAFPYQQPVARGGEVAALAHLQSYFRSDLPRHYKETRNGLIGFDYSTKFSPWLASGAISARQIYQQLTAHETEHGQNDSTYWIWFELLWRDYFRFLHLRFGRKLYWAHGLKTAEQPTPQRSATPPRKIPHQPEYFRRWCQGNTGQPLIDAGMLELKATGYLSNRMRQIVASYLVNDLQCDWRAGAAWFEAQLIDYDVYSNQGNWLYLAGFGTDPRSNRRFNLEKQIQSYDPEHAYQKLWRRELGA